MTNELDKYVLDHLLDKLNNQLLFLCVWGLKLSNIPKRSANYETYLTELSD